MSLVSMKWSRWPFASHRFGVRLWHKTLAPTTKGPRLASRPVDDARPRPMGVSPRLNVWGNGPARRNPDPRRLRRSRDLELLAKLSNHALPVTSEQIL